MLAAVPNMVVEYRDSTGRARAGVAVRIESVSWRVGLQRIGDVNAYNQALTATTDANGRVVVRVIFGSVAGQAWVRATATDFGLSDSVSYTLLPGALAQLRLAPMDTAVYVGNTVQLRARTYDSWGNERTGDIVQWSAPPGIVEATQPGLFRGVAFGRASVQAQVGSVKDSVQLSVVPRGTIASTTAGYPAHIEVFNTDGTGFQRIEIGGGCAEALHWTPSSTEFIFARGETPGSCFPERLFTMDFPAGTATQLIRDSIALEQEYWPSLSKDGQWIYFTGQPGHQNGEIWRVRSDGSGAERIGPAAGFDDMDQAPAPSPDGTQVLYWSVRQGETTHHLRVINLATLTVSDLGISGMMPTWSPRGDSIAFLLPDSFTVNGYYISIAHGDGQGERRLVDVRYTSGPPAWSPDGRWIAAVVSDGRVALVNVAMGVTLPLGWTSGLGGLTWRPEQP